MKTLFAITETPNFYTLNFDALTSDELNNVKGGTSKGLTREEDVYAEDLI